MVHPHKRAQPRSTHLDTGELDKGVALGAAHFVTDDADVIDIAERREDLLQVLLGDVHVEVAHVAAESGDGWRRGRVSRKKGRAKARGWWWWEGQRVRDSGSVFANWLQEQHGHQEEKEQQ